MSHTELSIGKTDKNSPLSPFSQGIQSPVRDSNIYMNIYSTVYHMCQQVSGQGGRNSPLTIHTHDINYAKDFLLMITQIPLAFPSMLYHLPYKQLIIDPQSGLSHTLLVGLCEHVHRAESSDVALKGGPQRKQQLPQHFVGISFYKGIKMSNFIILRILCLGALLTSELTKNY